jgi:hypothetical protein
VFVSVSFFLQSAMEHRGFVDAFLRRPDPMVLATNVGRFAELWLRLLAVRREWLLDGSCRFPELETRELEFLSGSKWLPRPASFVKF